jgi:DNA-binding transcriptional ArsR family regulator
MNTQDQQLDQLFHALADSTRRSILLRVRNTNETVSALTADYDMSMPAITKHLNILEDAGLITRTKHGRQRLCRAEPKNLNSAMEWLEHYQEFWNQQLDSLKEFIENPSKNKK